MSRQCKLVSPQPSTSRETPPEGCDTNWQLCCLCQQNTQEKTMCPAQANTPGLAYRRLADNIVKFSEIGCMPVDLDIGSLDEGQGIERTLEMHSASWHKSCFNKFNDLKLQRALKRTSSIQDCETVSPVKTRRSLGSTPEQSKTVLVCFFCEQSSGSLHRASTTNIDQNVRQCATVLRDSKLLAKLASGDMHAIDAYYHAKCLAALYKRARTSQSQNKEESSESSAESIVLAELVSYIEDAQVDAEVMPVFKLSDIAKLYQSRLKQLTTHVPDRINSTRLKDRLLFQIPGLKAYTEGREVLLAFEKDIGVVLQKACNNNDTHAIHLAKAATVVRQEMLSKKQEFNGAFEPDCQTQAVPETLLALVNMILNGPNIKDQESNDEHFSKSALAICQLLIFNMTKHGRSSSQSTRHNTERETPLAIYLALLIHAQTRKRELIDKLHDLGLCISYDRVMQISANMGNSVCALYGSENVVCPPKLREGLLTTGNVGNIDHNPSARTSKDSFHGTAISLTQHPSREFYGNERNVVAINPDIPKQKGVGDLPESYASVPPITLSTQDLQAPAYGPVRPATNTFSTSKQSEYEWLEVVQDLLKKEELEEEDYISWSAYFASMQPPSIRPFAITALLPMFHENAHTQAMILHSMKMIKDAVNHLNPGQTPVIAMDQPLYAIAKQIQWKLAGPYGEDQYIVMMGGLHIEMGALRLIGDWLENSGWTSALVQADITTAGKADAMLKASHVTRTRYAHQVTACALYALMRSAYQIHMTSPSLDQTPSEFSTWCDSQSQIHPQFKYWSTVLDLELLVMEFIKSLREGNFHNYVQTLDQLAPWMFTLDHSHYARWLPVHIRDMNILKDKHPDIYQQFQEGRFVVQKANHVFSLIALDQNHEQENESVKGDGGAIGLTEDPAALRRWMISGPEIARTVKEFETSFLSCQDDDIRHHEQVPAVQRTFAKDVKSLIHVIEEMGSPFLEDSADLLALDTKDIMPESVTTAVKNAQEIGQSQYDMYVKERLESDTKAISDTIPKNKLPLFGNPPKQKSKVKTQVSSLKSDCNLFSRLYISCQVRDGNLQEFFKHENQPTPPSLASMGKLRVGQKSEFLPCFGQHTVPESPEVDMKVLDGAAVVNMLPPKLCKTFDDYAKTVFLPYILAQVQNVKRLDIVWDRYIDNSLKQSTRENRGEGVRKRVTANATTPGNWQSFLRSDANKSELFTFLAEHLQSLNIEGKVLVSTCNEDAISSTPIDKAGIAPCNQEEADTRIFLHVAHAAKQGLTRAMVRTVDTDVIVLAVASMQKMQNLSELWMAFGTGKNFRFIPCHTIASSLGEESCKALPFFHAFTGCDTVSAFSGVGKKTA